MVVGAGRGPLVNRALEAADRAKYKVHVYAVEKNPMAIISSVDYICFDQILSFFLLVFMLKNKNGEIE